MLINIDLENDPSPSPSIHPGRGEDRRAVDFIYPARGLTARQALFYRNLLRIAVKIESLDIPIRFELPGNRPVYLDHGCIKIGVHAGFIRELLDGPSGYVETIGLVFHR